MNILELTGVVFSGALLAGLIGSLTGLGGGIIITPLLTLVLGVDVHYAIGAALVSVIATSCGAASAYVKEGLSNIRLGMLTAGGVADYHVHNIVGGTSVMLGAGVLSGLLGIGSGAFKVIAFDKIMRVPFKVSTTTSNFMIGVTAAASVGLYLQRGYIDPGLGMPVVLGVLCGSFLGARVLPGMKTSALRHVFAIVIAVLAIEMIFHGLKGTI